jgi:hypothetical protein
MVLLEKLKDEIVITPITLEEAQPFILKHYIGEKPRGIQKIYGVYHKPSGNKLVGTAIYGKPRKQATTVVQPEVSSEEVIELQRLFLEDYVNTKNIESYVISHTLKLIKQDFPSVKVVITFADEKAGHVGSIYQATNAIYLGKGSEKKHKYVYILRGNLKALHNLLQNKPYPKLQK